MPWSEHATRVHFKRNVRLAACVASALHSGPPCFPPSSSGFARGPNLHLQPHLHLRPARATLPPWNSSPPRCAICLQVTASPAPGRRIGSSRAPRPRQLPRPSAARKLLHPAPLPHHQGHRRGRHPAAHSSLRPAPKSDSSLARAGAALRLHRSNERPIRPIGYAPTAASPGAPGRSREPRGVSPAGRGRQRGPTPPAAPDAPRDGTASRRCCSPGSARTPAWRAAWA